MDAFYQDAKKKNKVREDFKQIRQTIGKNLSLMAQTFTEKDDLLKSAGMVVVYYVLFSRLRREKKSGLIRVLVRAC